jgi:TonB family protein
MKSYRPKSLCRFVVCVLILVHCTVPMAFSQAVASLKCSDCATMPKPTRLPKPAYPKRAKRLGIIGKVEVQITINRFGNVVAAKAIAGDIMLRRAAVGAALKAIFKPARSVSEPHHPVTALGQITYNFVLDDLPTRVKQHNRVLNGLAIYLPAPVYPQNAKESCADGRVEIEILIGKAGTVLSAKARTGNRLLQGFAVDAAKKAIFSTGVDSPIIQIRGVLIYNFQAPEGCPVL